MAFEIPSDMEEPVEPAHTIGGSALDSALEVTYGPRLFYTEELGHSDDLHPDQDSLDI
ncbi:MAG: hypothetical protein Q7T74_02790 [Candidatus Saccharibacteria bacterium]|nr:hypothetical protein [Candidatus Saccharibacteria bacterium]